MGTTWHNVRIPKNTMRAAYPFENTSAKSVLCLGSSSSSSRMESAPYTRNTTRRASSWRPLLFSHRGDSGTLHLPISKKTQGTMAEPSMSLHPPSTSHKAKPTTAATVAPKYHAAETMPIDIARWCLGGEFGDERGCDGVVSGFLVDCVDFGTASLVVIWVPLGPCRTVGNAFRFALRRRKRAKARKMHF